jgi:hypothetical protein
MSIHISAQNGEFDNSIRSSFSNGDYKSLAKQFSSNVEMTVEGANKVYSKVQAELVMKDFFKKNSAKGFQVLHKGTSKSGISYIMGTLNSTGKKYQISIYHKSQKVNRIIINSD